MWNNNLHHRCLLLRSPVLVNATGDAGYYFCFTKRKQQQLTVTSEKLLLRACNCAVRRKFVEALDENKKYASEAIVYIGKLYKIEEEMRVAGLPPEGIKERRQKESYPIIQEFEKWRDSVANKFTPKSRMGKALVYTYTLLPRLSR